MSTTELIKPPPPPSAGNLATPNAHPPDSVPPRFRDTIDEILPLIGVVPVAGPPVIFIAGPWILLALMLTGGFLLLVTFALAVIGLAAVSTVILAPPYLLVRQLGTYWTSQREQRTPDHPVAERDAKAVSLLAQHRGATLIDAPAEPSAAALRVMPIPGAD
jgi:hypothetical protein